MRFEYLGVAAAEMGHLVGQDGVGLALVEALQQRQADEQRAAGQLVAGQVHRVLGDEEVVVDAADDVRRRLRAEPAAQGVDAGPQRRRGGAGDHLALDGEGVVGLVEDRDDHIEGGEERGDADDRDQLDVVALGEDHRAPERQHHGDEALRQHLGGAGDAQDVPAGDEADVLQLARGKGQAGAGEHDDEREAAEAEARHRCAADPADVLVVAAHFHEEQRAHFRVCGGPVGAEPRRGCRPVVGELRGSVRRRVTAGGLLRHLEELAVPRAVGVAREQVACDRDREQQQRRQDVGANEPGPGGWLSIAHRSSPAPGWRHRGTSAR